MYWRRCHENTTISKVVRCSSLVIVPSAASFYTASPSLRKSPKSIAVRAQEDSSNVQILSNSYAAALDSMASSLSAFPFLSSTSPPCFHSLRSCGSLTYSSFSSLHIARRYIQQHRDEMLHTHGASFIRHQSIADKDLSTKTPGGGPGIHQVATALPAGDLFRTKVHEGLGTGENDPYDRTLPNIDSIPPATTVLYSATIQAPNEEEVQQISSGRVWHTLSVWWHEEQPRMPFYLSSQRIPSALPVSPVAEAMLAELTDRVLPSLASTTEELRQLQEWWSSAVETYQRCAKQYLWNPSRFMGELQRTHDLVMNSIAESRGREQLSLALEVLRRKAMATHNTLLEEYYGRIVFYPSLSSFSTPVSLFSVPSANEMWEIFLQSTKTYKDKIFVKTTDGPLLYAWEALLVEGNIRPPSMTAPVALFFALVTLQLQQRAVDAARKRGKFSPLFSLSSKGQQREKGDFTRETTSMSSSSSSPSVPVHMRRYLRYVSALTRRRYVLEELMDIFFSTPEELPLLSRKFHADGELELARDLAMCGEMLNNTELLKAEAASVVSPFSSTSEVKSLFASIYAGKDEDAKQHLCRTLGISKFPQSQRKEVGSSSTSSSSSRNNNSTRGRQMNWDKALEEADWENKWKSLVVSLLMHPPFLNAIHAYIKNAIAAKGVERELFHPNVAEQLDRIKQARAARDASCKQKANELIVQLSSYEWGDRTLRFLLEMEMEPASAHDPPLIDNHRSLLSLERRRSLLEPEATAAEEEERTRAQAPFVSPVTPDALAAALEAIQERHPQWVKSGVLPSLSQSLEEGTNSNSARADHPSPTSSSLLVKYFSTDPFAGLRVLTRIFIRLVYVPQAGAAMIAQRTRRRIGPVGLKPTEFNIPAEFGIVEQFDNLLYKRYDWQGWYQRMVDIHNRNVSLRCRLDDLKKLDAYGNPFVDLQTERRLRILCGDRVGMSVLKLDSDKYEDQSDNITYGVTKLSEILADSRKAQLGMEYWPTVEVKVRRPSGQSQAYYSVLDDKRIEEESKVLYEKYKELKKSSLFVTPMNLWLKTKGTQVRQKAEVTDEEGYSVASLHASLNDDDSGNSSA